MTELATVFGRKLSSVTMSPLSGSDFTYTRDFQIKSFSMHPKAQKRETIVETVVEVVTNTVTELIEVPTFDSAMYRNTVLNATRAACAALMGRRL